MTSAADAANRASQLRIMLFDVDGVLTDGTLMYGEDGEKLKAFNTLDGHGLKMLAEVGIRTGIITGRRSRALALRLASPGCRGRPCVWRCLRV